jgi:hypothetical protein
MISCRSWFRSKVVRTTRTETRPRIGRSKTSLEPQTNRAADQLSAAELAAIFETASPQGNTTLEKFADYRLGLLRNFHVETDCLALTKDGLRKETIAIALMAINVSPGVDNAVRTFGDKRARRRQRNALVKPLSAPHKIADLAGYDKNERLPRPMIPPDALISNLQLYRHVLTWVDDIHDVFECNSLSELSKYAFASLVKRVSNKYHDREVSALTGAALQQDDYDGTAHRVWRIRTVPRLDGKASLILRALQAFNTALSKT